MAGIIPDIDDDDDDDEVNQEETANAADDDDEDDDDGDPLMDLFENHNTRRVVFHLDGCPPPPRKESDDTSATNSVRSDSSSRASRDGGSGGASSDRNKSSQIRSFIRRIVFKGGRERDSEAAGIVDRLPPAPTCGSFMYGCFEDRLAREKAEAERQRQRGAAFPADPTVPEGRDAKATKSRSCFNAFVGPRDKHQLSDATTSTCSSSFMRPRVGGGDRDACAHFFRPRDPAEAEAARRAAEGFGAEPRGTRSASVDSNGETSSLLPNGAGGGGGGGGGANATASQGSGTRKLDPIAIDRAMSRSSEAAAVAKRATSRADGGRLSLEGSSGASLTPSGQGQWGADATAPLSASSVYSFVGDREVQDKAGAIIAKAEKAHHRSYRYERAIGYYLAALSLLSKAGYPDDHPLMAGTMRKLNDCHHAQSSLRNSADIVKMGIKHENKGEFVRALKMYTIAYRIRRDALGKFHPSLPVLLNMLGSVQVKRGELKEAMQIYELALNGRPDDVKDLSPERKAELIHPTTKSVTLRDMGMIHERWGDDEKALKLYQQSLEFVVQGRQRESLLAAKAKAMAGQKGNKDLGKEPWTDGSAAASASKPQASGAPTSERGDGKGMTTTGPGANQQQQPLVALDEVKFIRSHKEEKQTQNGKDDDGRPLSLPPRHPNSGGSPRSSAHPSKPASPEQGSDLTRSFSGLSESTAENGEMEMYLDAAFDSVPVKIGKGNSESEYYYYDAIFPPKAEDEKGSKGKAKDGSDAKKKKKRQSQSQSGSGGGGNDVNVAMTLHQIAQIYRRRGQYSAALSAYQASLRGMKQALGDRHPNVAAILGNLGNLHKEMGNYDQAYNIYQEVLGIETLHLGLTHPEVSVTLHNIATIESSRGRYGDAINLYKQVVKMQQTLFGPGHISVAVTSSCMGDVYERMGDDRCAMTVYEESLKIRTEILGRKHVDVGRLLHKLGSLAQKLGDYKVAGTYLLRAASIYDANELKEDHPWVRDMERDRADVQAHLSLTKMDQRSL